MQTGEQEPRQFFGLALLCLKNGENRGKKKTYRAVRLWRVARVRWFLDVLVDKFGQLCFGAGAA